jgi:antitoxin CcdA
MRIKYAHTPWGNALPNRSAALRRRRKATNVTVDEELLERARRLKLNLSQVLEAGLAEAVRRHEGEEWLRSNREALKAYNAHIDKDGVFGDDLRTF